MPLYDYACTKCGHVHEVRHGFDETHDRPCDACGAPLRRVFNPAPVLFKGSGFYVTDSRGSKGGGKTEKPKEETSSSPATESKPAAGAGETKSSESAA